MRFTMATVAASRRDSLAPPMVAALALGPHADNEATRGAMRIQSAAAVLDPAFRCDHGSTARNHCPDHVQGPTVGKDRPNEFHRGFMGRADFAGIERP
jgi:hypothetical protein